MRRDHVRTGITLVELVVTLAILGLMAGIVGVAYWNAPPSADDDNESAILAAARRQAIRDRRVVTVTVRVEGRIVDATALPDGSIVYEGSDVSDFSTNACEGTK